MEQNITFTLDKERFNVLNLIGSEAISKPYQFVIDILTHDLNPNDYISTPATINLNTRSISGIITEGKQNLLNMAGQTHTSFTLEPRLTLANLSQNVRVIINQTVPEIIRDILSKAGYQKQQIKWHLASDYQLKPYRMQVTGETDLQFMHRLLANAEIFYWLDSEIIHFSDNNDFSPYLKLTDEPYKLTKQYSAFKKAVIAETTMPELQPGFSIILKNQDYIIPNISHYFAQNIEQQGQNIFYHNQVQLQPRATPINIEKPKFPQFPAVFQAHIESNSNYAYLDEGGNYYLRQRFDLATITSPPLAKLTPYHGWHMPLRKSAEVLVSSKNGDPDEPIIIGSIPNADQLSPVTAITKSHNKIATASNNQLLMDDTLNKQKIQLTTREQNNLLELNADQSQPHVNLISKQGAMTWQAKQTLQIHSNKNTQENIGNDRVQTAAQNHQTQTKNQNIDYQAGANQQLQSHNNLRLQAGQNIELTANNNLNIQSKNQVYLTTKGQQANFNIQDGNLFLQSANDINIIGNGNGDIEFTQNNAGFKITKNGTVEIYGKNINGLTDGNLTVKGKINYLDSTPQIAPPTTIPELITPKAIDESKKIYPAAKFDLSSLLPVQVSSYPTIYGLVSATLSLCGTIILKSNQSFNLLTFDKEGFAVIAKQELQKLAQNMKLKLNYDMSEVGITCADIGEFFTTEVAQEGPDTWEAKLTPSERDSIHKKTKLWTISGELGFEAVINIDKQNRNPLIPSGSKKFESGSEIIIGAIIVGLIAVFVPEVVIAGAILAVT